MYLKTTSINFQKYGTTFTETTPRKIHYRNSLIRDITKKVAKELYHNNEDVYFRVNEGIVLLIITNDLSQAIETFVVHQVVRINKGNYFNLLSISSSANIEVLTFDQNEDHDVYPLAEPFIYKPIVPSVKIKEIFSYYYVVRGTNYNFPGEIHHFWELTMINSGVLRTVIEDKEYILKDNELILYAPGQFHTQYTSVSETTSYITVVFEMDVACPEDLKNKIFHSERDIRKYIEDFIKYSTRDVPYNDDLLITSLEKIIIALLRSEQIKAAPVATTLMQQKFDSELLDGILNYIQENIYSPLTVEELCEKFSVSRSSLQVLFKNNLDIAPKQYISNLKLARSKQLIKENNRTISEIAVICGFASIHYFSRKFKKEFGITPSEYAKTYIG